MEQKGVAFQGRQYTDTVTSAVIVISKEGVTGRIDTEVGSYALSPLGDGLQATILLNKDSELPDHPDNGSYGEENDDCPEQQWQKELETACETDSENIQLLVAYTSAAKQRLPFDISSAIEFAVADTKKANLNSHLGELISLAHSVEVEYHAEGGSIVDDLEALQRKSDDKLEVVHKLRDLKAGDLVFLIVDRPGVCGYVSSIPATPSTAFAVVTLHCLLTQRSFTHEFGHLLGARHEISADPCHVPFPHGHGYAEDGHFRTLMATPSSCQYWCRREGKWSNPYSDAGKSGESENYRVIRDMAESITNFRCSQ